MISPHLMVHKLAAVDPRLAHAGLLYSSIANKLTPDIYRKLGWAVQQMAVQERKHASVSSMQLETRASAAVSSAFKGAIPPGTDIEELAFVVLMIAATDQDDDLQQIMNEVQAQTAAKQFLRQQMQIVNTDVANNADTAVSEAQASGQPTLVSIAVAHLTSRIKRK